MHQPRKYILSAQKLWLLTLLLLAALGACEAPAEIEAALTAPQSELSCGENGALESAMFGAIETSISWAAPVMDCESMPRPDGEGVRLRFAGEVSGERLAIIIAMPGLNPDTVNVDVPSNVTATVEGSGRFFSTTNLNSCWTEVALHHPLPLADGSHAIDGTLFCISPLAEVNGDAAVSIPQLVFSTIVQWGGS